MVNRVDAQDGHSLVGIPRASSIKDPLEKTSSMPSILAGTWMNVNYDAPR